MVLWFLGRGGIFGWLRGVTFQWLVTLKIDKEGNTIWSHIYDDAPASSLSITQKVMVVISDTIYVACEVVESGVKELRLMSFNMEGILMNEQDISIPYENTLYIRGLEKIDNNSRLVLYGHVIFPNIGKKVFMRVFDLQFNVLVEWDYGDPAFPKGPSMDFIESGDGSYTLAFSEQSFPFNYGLVILKLDNSFEVTFSKKVLEEESDFPTVDIFETEDKGWIVGWTKDLWDTQWDTFPYPAAVYKLDSLANVEWEYVFAHRNRKQLLSIEKVTGDKIFGIGTADYSGFDSLYLGSSEGFCFLMDLSGNLLWERIIADVRESYGCRFIHGIPSDEGYAIVGDIDKINPTGVPALNNPDVWYVTLDENGCWNENCNKYIAITGDITTGVYRPEPEKNALLVYPNPTHSFVVLEGEHFSKSGNNYITISDLKGQVLMRYRFFGEKQIIDLSNLSSDIYIVTQIVDNHIVQSTRIAVNK